MLERVREVIAEYKEMEIESITKDTKFEDLDLDSLDMVELVMQLEEELGMNLELNEDIKTVGQLVELIEA